MLAGRYASQSRIRPFVEPIGERGHMKLCITATTMGSYIRVALLLARTAGVGYGPAHRRPNLLGILPERA